jgi:hypothetical protein
MATNRLSTPNEQGSRQGVLSFLFAVLTALSVAMIGFTSFTPFDPPGWLRIATMAPLPILIILAIGFGLPVLKRVSGRFWAVAGLILTALSVIAFIVMINVGS